MDQEDELQLCGLVDHALIGSPPRSHHWPACRAAFLKMNPTCAACGGTEFLQVHHMKPFHIHPELELDHSNLITLCENPLSDHHLHIGHNGDWRSFNPHVVADAEKALKSRPKITEGETRCDGC